MIRITKDWTHETGAMFWKGERFDPVQPPNKYGVEVKTGGDYMWLPPDIYEVVT